MSDETKPLELKGFKKVMEEHPVMAQDEKVLAIASLLSHVATERGLNGTASAHLLSILTDKIDLIDYRVMFSLIKELVDRPEPENGKLVHENMETALSAVEKIIKAATERLAGAKKVTLPSKKKTEDEPVAEKEQSKTEEKPKDEVPGKLYETQDEMVAAICLLGLPESRAKVLAKFAWDANKADVNVAGKTLQYKKEN